MEFKPGVGLKGIQPEIMIGLSIAEGVYKSRLLTMTVTSVNDSKHMPTSLHYKGLAADIRTKGTGLAMSLFLEIKKRLSPLGFDVLLEYQDEPQEHIHLEFDPKE